MAHPTGWQRRPQRRASSAASRPACACSPSFRSTTGRRGSCRRWTPLWAWGTWAWTPPALLPASTCRCCSICQASMAAGWLPRASSPPSCAGLT